MSLVPSRVRLLAVLALAAAVLPAVPSRAGLVPHTMTFSGSRPASMTWATGVPVRITVSGLRPSCDKAEAVVHLGGRYAGVDIRSRSGKLVFQAWAVRGTGFGGTDEETSSCPYLVMTNVKQDTPVTPGYVQLEPGSYTVSFLTDAPSTIRFSYVSGLRRATTLAPTHRVHTPKVTYTQKTGPLSSFTDHVRLRPGSFGLALFDIRAPGPASVLVNDTCFAREESSCDATTRGVGEADSTGFSGTGLSTHQLIRPGQYPPGAYSWSATGAATSPFAVMTCFTLVSEY